MIRAAVAAAVLALLPAAAHAGAFAFVSPDGKNQGNCQITPCLSLTYAAQQVDPYGVVVMKDVFWQNEFAVVTKPVSIKGNGAVIYGIRVELSSNAQQVSIEDLDFEGHGPGMGVHGVEMKGKGRLRLRNATVANYTGAGVRVAGGDGVRVFLDDVRVFQSGIGVEVNPASGANFVVLNDCVVDRSASFGLKVAGGSSAAFGRSTFTGTVAGQDIRGPGALVSYGDNIVRSGTPSQTVPLK